MYMYIVHRESYNGVHKFHGSCVNSYLYTSTIVQISGQSKPPPVASDHYTSSSVIRAAMTDIRDTIACTPAVPVQDSAKQH